MKDAECQAKCSPMTRAGFPSTRSPPRLRRLLTASRCRRFHSRVSSPCLTSKRAQITASSSVGANLTSCMWPFYVKKSGRDVSRALYCALGADRALRLDVATGTDTGALGKAGASWFMSKSRSSSESRSRWLISEKPVKEFVNGHDGMYCQQLTFLFPRCEQVLKLVLGRRLSEIGCCGRWCSL